MKKSKKVSWVGTRTQSHYLKKLQKKLRVHTTITSFEIRRFGLGVDERVYPPAGIVFRIHNKKYIKKIFNNVVIVFFMIFFYRVSAVLDFAFPLPPFALNAPDENKKKNLFFFFIIK